MHLALPTRKSSNPPPFKARSSRHPNLRRGRIQALVAGALSFTLVLFILSRLLGGGEHIPSGTPSVVIVTVLDPAHYTKEYLAGVKENRNEYAAKHGMRGIYCYMVGDLQTQVMPHLRLTILLTRWRTLPSHGQEYLHCAMRSQSFHIAHISGF